MINEIVTRGNSQEIWKRLSLRVVLFAFKWYYLCRSKVKKNERNLFRPSNVLLNEYSNLKLCDFGLAKKIVDLI